MTIANKLYPLHNAIARPLLYFSTGFLRCRIIALEDQPYLERYYLCTYNGRRYYIHRFLASDPERGLHDHPWAYSKSLILAGSYIEIRLTDKDITHSIKTATRLLNPFSTNIIAGDDFHRVVLPEGGKEVWSLFSHTVEADKDWGFLDMIDGQPTYTPHNDYTKPDGDHEDWIARAKRGFWAKRQQFL